MLIELGTRLAADLRHQATASASTATIPDFIVNWETEPGLGDRLPRRLARQGRREVPASANPTRASGRCTRSTTACSTTGSRSYQYMRNWNQGYLEWSRANRITRYAEPILIHLYSEVLQRFRSAAEAKGLTRKPPEHLASSESRPISTRCRSSTSR